MSECDICGNEIDKTDKGEEIYGIKIESDTKIHMKLFGKKKLMSCWKCFVTSYGFKEVKK